MSKFSLSWWIALLAAGAGAPLSAQVPDNLVTENIPPIPLELRQDASRYLEFRAAAFNGWHPSRREILITTRFADSTQLHQVNMPGGARRQLTFLAEPVAGGAFQPKKGNFIVFSQDAGGGEFYQLYRYDPDSGKITLLTDGKSRNSGANWSKGGEWLAYTSTRRNGKDNDIYVVNPAHPDSNKMLIQVSGGGWSVTDWSADDSRLLVREYISINESRLYVTDAATGRMEPVFEGQTEKVSYGKAKFSKDGKFIYATTDKDFEFERLVRINLKTKKIEPITNHLRWDVTDFDISSNGRLIAFVTNEDGVSILHLYDTRTGREVNAPKLPLGVIGNLEWHENSEDLGFNLASARSPSDVFSYNVKSRKLDRWTVSETGGLNASSFREPELVKLKSFDGLGISAFVYRPDPARFPGKRPALIVIHGGPESQSRPIFMARNNFYLNELGLTLIYPNVRGSSGYGKTFLTLDNGFKREDSVKDIGAVIQWARQDAALDSERIGVMGGSYGGYMVLASMTHFSDQLRCGVDVVGISHFVTFLKNTQDYRRDLRRAEYGNEENPEMRAFLEKISPLSNVEKIRKPLFVVQGKNDPRVPVTEAEQMVEAIRQHGGIVWYLMAKDEGHGFAKKKNADYQFLATVLFLREHLLK